jgi:hypothetical protein
MRRAALPLAVLALAACGGSDPAATTTERDESPALPTPTPTPTPTTTATPPTATAPSAPSPPPDAEGGEGGEGGAGDEEAARTQVRVVVDGEGVIPPRTEVPAFLAVRVTVRNDLPQPITVALRGGHSGRQVAARREGTFDVAGLQPGEYAIDAGEAGHATLVAVRP